MGKALNRHGSSRTATDGNAVRLRRKRQTCRDEGYGTTMLTTSCSGDDGEDAPYLSNTFVGAQAARPGPDNQHPVLRPRTGTANDEQYLSCFYAHTQLRVDVKGSRGALGQGEKANSQFIKLPHLVG